MADEEKGEDTITFGDKDALPTVAFPPKANSENPFWQVFWLGLLLNTFPSRFKRDSGRRFSK
jgi:hypothetical protein